MVLRADVNSGLINAEADIDGARDLPLSGTSPKVSFCALHYLAALFMCALPRGGARACSGGFSDCAPAPALTSGRPGLPAPPWAGASEGERNK